MNSINWLIFLWRSGVFMVREELASKLSFRPVMAPRGPRSCGVASTPLLNGPGRQVDHTSASSAEFKNMWSYAFTSSLRHYGVDRGNLYLSTWTYPKCLGAPHSMVSIALNFIF